MEEGIEKGKNSVILELLKAKQPLPFISQVSKYPIERIAEIGRIMLRLCFPLNFPPLIFIFITMLCG